MHLPLCSRCFWKKGSLSGFRVLLSLKVLIWDSFRCGIAALVSYDRNRHWSTVQRLPVFYCIGVIAVLGSIYVVCLGIRRTPWDCSAVCKHCRLLLYVGLLRHAGRPNQFQYPLMRLWLLLWQLNKIPAESSCWYILISIMYCVSAGNKSAY